MKNKEIHSRMWLWIFYRNILVSQTSLKNINIFSCITLIEQEVNDDYEKEKINK